MAALTALPGLGRWTADWFLARHLARPRAWPAGDLGVRKAVSAFYADGRPLSIKEVRAMGERFAPFENLSAQFLLMGARLEDEPMNVRRATIDDYDALAELWREFDHEVPPPTHEGPNDLEKELAEIREILESDIAFLALDDEGTPVGFALARHRAPGSAR